MSESILSTLNKNTGSIHTFLMSYLSTKFHKDAFTQSGKMDVSACPHSLEKTVFIFKFSLSN